MSFRLFDGSLPAAFGLARLERLSLVPRIAVAVLVTWVPLVALALAQGRAVAEDPNGSLLGSVAVHARFLVALPLLLIAPAVCGPRLRPIAQHFLDAGLVKEAEKGRFAANIATTMRLRDSRLAAALLLVLAYLQTVLLVAVAAPELPALLHTVGPEEDRGISLAAWWFVAVSQPVYFLVLFLFLYRVLLWWLFLWRTARLDLRLAVAHPDGAGGLGFLGLSIAPFAIPAFAIAAALSGGLAELVLRGEVSLAGRLYLILGIVVPLVGLFTGPVLLFAVRLAEAKRRGLLDYARLSDRQLRQFGPRWFRPGRDDDPILAGQEFSAAADLGLIVARVQDMRVVPCRWKDVVPVAGAALLAFVPTAALEVPLAEFLPKLIHLLI